LVYTQRFPEDPGLSTDMKRARLCLRGIGGGRGVEEDTGGLWVEKNRQR